MKKLVISFVLIFLSLNISAAISQDGITNLKQLDSNGIIELISGNQLTGFISDGPFQGPVVQTFFKNGKYETIFEDKIYKGVWKVENKKYCSKNNAANNFNCVYWYTGNKDGGTYAYIIAQGQIFHQYHEVKSVVKINQEKKKAAEAKRIADAKKAEEKKKAAEAKRIADAKKAEEKKKAAEEKLNQKLSLLQPKTKLLNAQNFIKDVVEFVEENPNEFDIMEVAMFKINTKLISKGTSDDEQMKTIDSFKEFVKSSPAFLEFQKKNEDARTQTQLNKIDKVLNKLDRVIGNLKSLSKKNMSSNSASLLDEKINSSEAMKNNAKTLSELENVEKELTFFLSTLRAEIKVNVDNKRIEEELEKDIKFSKKNLFLNIYKLKTYLAENISSISPELMTLIVEKVSILESTKQQKFTNKKEELLALNKVNDEISSFSSNNNILTAAEITATKKKAEEKKKADAKKKAEEKKKADAKKKAEEKKKADAKEAERLKNFKEIFMTCGHTLNEYFEIQWAFDGKIIYQDGFPLKIGKTPNPIDNNFYWFVEKLSLYQYKVSMLGIFGMQVFTIDFENYKSRFEHDLFGVREYAYCY